MCYEQFEKILYFTRVCGGASIFSAHAQWGVGVEAGYTHNHLTYSPSYFYTLHYVDRGGFSLSVPVQYSFKDWVAVRAELAYLQKNFGIRRSGYYQEIYQNNYNHYIDIPVMARFSFGGKKLRGFVDAGGYVGAWGGASIEGRTLEIYSATYDDLTDLASSSYNMYDYDEAYAFDSRRDNRFDAGLIVGLGITYQITGTVGISANCRYWYALTDIQKNYMRNLVPQYHNTITAQVGVMFTFPQK